MAICLNTRTSFILYEELMNSQYFVDRSAIIENMNKCIRTNTKYVCITKPRRFGKTSVINMLGVYYGKADDTPEAAISQIKEKEYCEKLKKENVEKILLVA